MTLQAVASSSRQVELICRFGADVPEFVIGDPTRLRQILLNIISNATKFTPKGEVSLYVTREPDAECADMLCFTIHDTGIGIEEDKIKNIFTPFSQAKSSTTRKFGGSGLGLSISKSLTELMGGRIRAESSPGNGSTFIVEIPLPRDPESESLLAPDFSGKTILVAVKNETLAETLTELVELYGAETICSTSAVEFKSELEIERRKPIDAIIVDQEIDETDSVFILESQLGKSSINAPKSILLTRGLSSKKRIQGLEDLIPASCPKPVPRRLLLRQLIDILHGDEGSEINRKDETEILPDLKILVAENDIPSRELIRHFLKPFGTTIVMSSDGREALKLALNNDFDLVMLEMEIPSMDGSSFLGRLRAEEKAKKKSRLPVLAFSAYPSADSREKSMDAGADSFISKPMDKNQLIREIKKLTRK